MCGIAGLFSSRGSVAEADVRRMCDVIVHRGPDDEGIHVDAGVGLGMRRLSIIDVATGHQPIHNEDRTVWVVFNGEIYNYREVRAELEKAGHRFYTKSDTEVLVHLYEEHGEKMLSRLNGMFAFAIWDAKRERLFLARDRIGEKQLFYVHKDGVFAFGSEIKCLLAHGNVSSALDPLALDGYLSYLYTPAPRSIYRDVREVPPGHFVVVEKDSLRVERYWDLEYRIGAHRSDVEIVEDFRRRFEASVRARLVSEVPLGALLSGGVDSSAIVAAMAQASAGPIKTFCIGYSGDAKYNDERHYARMVAERFGTDHREFVVEPHIVEDLPAIVDAFDQPFADSSAIVNFYVFREAHRHVKVVLSGLGGDELAGGYERHLGVRLRSYYHVLPQAVRRHAVERVVMALPLSRRGGRFIERAKRFVRTGELTDGAAYRQIQSAFDEPLKHHLYTPEFADRVARAGRDEDPIERHFDRHGTSDVLNRALYTDLMTYLPGDLLPLNDRMSMAHSVEARSPFLDHELFEFVASVPPRLKIKGFEKKHLLKRAFENVLPKEVLYRRKQGFSVPLSVWFRGELAPMLEEKLSAARIKAMGWLDASAVQRLLNEHASGRANHDGRIWALLMLALWHERNPSVT